MSYRTTPEAVRCKPHGFTLIELIVVMVIMSVLVTVAAPRLVQSDSQDRATAERLRSSLRYVQRTAVTRNRDVCVTVAATTITFRLAPSAGTGVVCGATSLSPLADSGDTLDISVANSPLTFSPASSFRFTPAGLVTNNFGFAIPAPSISVMRDAFTFATLTIQPDNGFVLASTF